jgi:hypothetical protein
VDGDEGDHGRRHERLDSDDEVEREFRAKLAKGNEGEIAVSSDPAVRKIAEGFSM